MNRTLHASVSRACMAATMSLALCVPFVASAQSADNPPPVKRAHTLKSPPRDGKVMNSVERGSNAAGRGVNRAEDATRRGVNNVSERAARPVRNVGESLGRKLPGGGSHPAPPPVGPTSNTPSPG